MTSNIGDISASGGSFYITRNGVTTKADLGSIIMMLQIENTTLYDTQIRDQMTGMKERNDKVRKMTEFLAYVRNLKGSSATVGSGYGMTIGGVKKTAEAWCKEFGIPGWTTINTTDSTKRAQQVDANVSNIRDALDLHNNESQLDNTRLQNLLNKRNNAFEMVTKILDSQKQSVQSIIRNL